MATIRYRQNTFSTLKREDGSVASEHHEKAGLLWQAYHDRLGVSMPIDPSFDFSTYIHPRTDLHNLLEPFSREEIDKIVQELPIDKALGPDGFSGLFIKKCWQIIKYDFFRLCDDFWEGNVNL
jgi:hypothetical protein